MTIACKVSLFQLQRPLCPFTRHHTPYTVKCSLNLLLLWIYLWNKSSFKYYECFFLKFVKWKSVTNEIRFNYLITASNLQHVLNKYLSSFVDSDILCFGFLWIFPFPFHALLWIFSSSCCGSVTQSCLTLCDPMDCGMPGFPVLHYLPEFAQIHVNDAIQPSSSSVTLFSSPLALNISQYLRLFQWVGSLHQVAKVLELQLQYQSF